MKRRFKFLVGVGAGAASAAYVISRRRRAGVRVALYYADGALVGLPAESPDALELRALAGDLRRAFDSSSA